MVWDYCAVGQVTACRMNSSGHWPEKRYNLASAQGGAAANLLINLVLPNMGCPPFGRAIYLPFFAGIIAVALFVARRDFLDKTTFPQPSSSSEFVYWVGFARTGGVRVRRWPPKTAVPIDGLPQPCRFRPARAAAAAASAVIPKCR